MTVYLINERGTDRYKIGVSSDPNRRLVGMQTSNAGILDLIQTWPGGIAEEQSAHKEFASYRLTGEWFEFDGGVLPHVLMFLTSKSLKYRMDGQAEALSEDRYYCPRSEPLGSFDWEFFVRVAASVKVDPQVQKILIPRTILREWYRDSTGEDIGPSEFKSRLKDNAKSSELWRVSTNRSFQYRAVAWEGPMVGTSGSYRDWNALEDRRDPRDILQEIKSHNCQRQITGQGQSAAHLFEAHSDGVVIPDADTILFSDGSTASWNRLRGCWAVLP